MKISATVVTTIALSATSLSAQRDTHERLHGALWMQSAPEYRFSCRTIYQLAQAQLLTALADKSWTASIEQEQTGNFADLPPAVILDLDETVLDNSPLQAQLAINRSPYDINLWSRWVKEAKAKAIPGAVEFITSCRSAGVKVYFVTNRTQAEEQDTSTNLDALGILEHSVDDTILTKGEQEWTSEKQARRAFVATRYRVLLLIGDDLGDFVAGAKATITERNRLAEAHASRWGASWMLLSNPLYGSWEAATFDNDSSLLDPAVLATKFSKLGGFSPAGPSSVPSTPTLPTVTEYP